MYLLRRGALFHFSRKLPDAFQGQNLNLASGPRKVGGNGYLRFVSDLKMEKSLFCLMFGRKRKQIRNNRIGSFWQHEHEEHETQ